MKRTTLLVTVGVNAVLYATLIVPSNTTDEGIRMDEPKPRNCNVR